MARMGIGINAANLATEGFELEIPSETGSRFLIVLGQSGGLTGRYEQDEGRIGLRKLTAHQFSLEKLELPVAGGTLRVDAPSILNGVALDAELGGGRAFEGQLRLAGAAAQLVFERGPLAVRAALRVAHASYEQNPRNGQHGELESAEVGALRVELEGHTVVLVERLALRGVRFAIGARGELSVACKSAHADAVVVEHGGRRAELGQIAFDAGFELDGDTLRWPELTLESLTGKLPELPRPSRAPAPRTQAKPAALDLSLLDHLQGTLAFDLLLDVRLPILPDRRATHSIRVPVEHGSINFKQLEHCLSALEDALFDFEVNEDGLIFELDPIPGMTLDNVTLVTWPLSGQEHVLAKTRNEIRLRRLLEYRLSPKLTGSGEPARPTRSGGASGLRRLHIGNIETVLRLGGPTELVLPGLGLVRLGTTDRPAAGELRLSGQIEHAPGEPPTPTELRLDAHDLSLGVSLQDNAGRRVAVAHASVRRLDGVRLGLLGLEPRSASLNAEGIRLAGVELHGWFGKSASHDV
jgi:hypothetical protein